MARLAIVGGGFMGGALAEGLIRGCVAHYGEAVDIAVEDLSDGAGTAARFVLSKRGEMP